MLHLKRFLSLAFLLLPALPAMAQDTVRDLHPTPERRKEIYDSLRRLPAEERRNMYRQQHPRKPALIPPAQKKMPVLPKKKEGNTLPESMGKVPADARFPGEYEEMQAVFISWPYTYAGSVAIIDTLQVSPYAKIFGQLADAIQQSDAKVFINVMIPEDTDAVRQFMSDQGTPLLHHRFFVAEGDAFWARDFGPVSYYYSAADSIGWVDLKYYPGRDFDDVLPILWGAELHYPVTTTTVNYEGGNIVMDGCNNLSSSDMVFELNDYTNSYTQQMVRDSLGQLLHLGGRHDWLPYLPRDGGTGHVDLYLDMLDENTFVHTAYPSAMAAVPGFPDYHIALRNLDTLAAHMNHAGKKHRFYSIPLPSKDDGSWYSTGGDYEGYTRTYSNHLVLNKTIVQPIFCDGSSGNVAGDTAALRAIRRAYPGYRILPIDMRAFDGFGGSIHCITKELPADNPIRILHYPYRELEPRQSSYPLDAVIRNKSGIASAKACWRRKGTTAWNVVPLSAAPGDHFIGQLPGSLAASDTLEYYLSAVSNNGKTITRPMTAPAGYYTFWYAAAATAAGHVAIADAGNMYPNPATDGVHLELSLKKQAQVSVRILDNSGRLCAAQEFGVLSGNKTLYLHTAMLAPGIYKAEVWVNGQAAFSRKLIRR